MQALRALAHTHRRLALLLVLCALALKALVPAGFMPGQQGTTITIEICADASGSIAAQQIVIPRADAKQDHGKDGTACSYAALGFAALAGADAALLALALAFILALGFAPAVMPPLRRIAFLRPPLRGPPATA
ncbi:MAG: DUF2946 family protein [Novosphingobium sp.]